MRDHIITRTFNEYEFNTNILNSDTAYHYTELMKEKGFKVTENNKEPDFYENEAQGKAEMKEIKEIIKSEFEQQRDTIIHLIREGKTEEIKPNEIPLFNNIKKHLDLLGLKDKLDNTELIEDWKYIIGNDRLIEKHLQTVKLFYDDSKLKNITREELMNDSITSNAKSTITKIRIIRELENKINMAPFGETFTDGTVEISDEDHKYYKTLFRFSKDKPKTAMELHELIMKMYKHINEEIIKTEVKQIRKGKDRTREHDYTFDTDQLLKHMKLYAQKNDKLIGVNHNIDCLKEFIKEHTASQDKGNVNIFAGKNGK